MPGAARVGDSHTCPLVSGSTPHVGGPILPPGSPTVLIGGLAAARVGDPATCTGPPDTIAAGWAFYDIKWKKIAPKAFIFGVTNPVMVQGAVFAGIPITAGWAPHPRGVVKTGDRVRVDPARKVIEVL